MKLSVDRKFLGTTLLVSATLLAVIGLVNAILGPTPAAFAGTLFAAIAVKLFDKLEFNPADEIRFGAPLVSVPWVVSAIAAILMLYGSGRLGGDLVSDITGFPTRDGACSSTYVVGIAIAEWGGLLGAGWLIGRVFPRRAQSLASLAFVVLVAEWWLDTQGMTGDRMSRILKCLSSGAGTDISPDDMLAYRVGTIGGLVVKGMLTIMMARLAARGSSSAGVEEPDAAA